MYPGHWATVFPDKAAAVDTGTGAVRTFGELNDRSNRLAQVFRNRGLRRGDHVSIFMENNLAYFDVMWAALRSGLYLTSVNRYLTAEEAGYIVDNSESSVLVASRAVAEVASDARPYAPNCKTYLMVDGAVDGFEDFEEAIVDFPAEPVPDEPAGGFMLYSSGTTGRPKGILRPLPETSINQPAETVGLLNMLWGVDQNTVYLSPAPLYPRCPLGFARRCRRSAARRSSCPGSTPCRPCRRSRTTG